MISKYLNDYLQRSFIYDNFFTESINGKIDTINNIKYKLNELKLDKELLSKIKSGNYVNNILTNKTIGNIHIELQNFVQESDIIPIIINGAIMTSFQLLETFFFNIFGYYTKKDYMGGDISKWIKEIEKNDIFNGKDKLISIIGQDVFNSILEYNKRRDLCTHSFSRITSKYIDFLNKNPNIKNKLEQINNLESIPFTQKYKAGETLLTGEKYYSINQMLLDLIACKTCLYLTILEGGNIHNLIEDITSTVLINKKYVLCASLLIGMRTIKEFSLNIDSEIDLLFACDRINRGGFKKEKDKLYSICEGKIKLMNKKQLFKRHLINNNIENVSNNIPENGDEIISLMNSAITTFYFREKSTTESISSKIDRIKINISDKDYKKLSINGINNLKSILN